MAEPDQHKSRRIMVVAAVLTVIVLALGTMVLIGVLLGDDTDDDTIKQPQDTNGSASLVTPYDAAPAA